MDYKTLTRFAKPYTTPAYEEQAVIAAGKRRVRMIPGMAPPVAPGEDPVSNYQGAVEDVVLGEIPMRLSNEHDGVQEPRSE